MHESKLLKPGLLNVGLIQRFWDKIQKSSSSACWSWTGCTVDGGYGQIWCDGKMLRAHRVSWELHNGLIPDGLHVLHKCDNRNCCNPGHLFLGTHSENMLDMYQKGRSQNKPPVMMGESNPSSKLTKKEAEEIKLLKGIHSDRKVAKIYGVNRSTITGIFTGRLWK